MNSNIISSFFTAKKISFSKKKLAVIGLIVAAFGYSILGVNSRLLSQGFDSMTQVYVRISVGFLLSLFAFRKDIKIKKIRKISKSDLFWLLMMGVVGYSVGVWMITIAVLNSKLVNASAIFATTPFAVYLYSFFLLKEKINPKLIFLLSLAIYGVIIISSKSFIPTFAEFGKGEIFAVLSVITTGWWSVGRKMLSNKLNNKEITVIVMFIAAVSGIIIAMIKGEPLPIQSFTMTPVLIGIAIGAILNFALTFLENFSFQHISAVIGSQILMTSVGFSLILGLIFYQEAISIPELIGVIIIFFSVHQANKLIK
jgi:drug/metabolite transporter (DMT)-like permease